MPNLDTTTVCLLPTESQAPQQDVAAQDQSRSGHPNSEMRAAYLRALACQPAAPRAID